MKRILTALALALGLAVTNAQSNSNGVASTPQGNAANGWLNALSATNLTFGTYGLYDLTSKTLGGGVFGMYDLNQYIGGVIKLDYINHSIYDVRGNVALQLPIHPTAISNPDFKIVPFTFVGVGTPIGGKGVQNGGIVYQGALGIGVQVNKWLAIHSAYEKWSGGGFNDNLVSFSLDFKLW